MNQPQQQDPVFVQKVLWFAFIASVGVFAFVMVFIVNPDPSAPFELRPDIMMFAFIGMTNAALSFFLPKLLIPKTEPGQPIDPNSLFVPFVLRMALSESVGIMGLLAAMMSNKYEVAVPFFVVSFFCVLLGKPKSE